MSAARLLLLFVIVAGRRRGGTSITARAFTLPPRFTYRRPTRRQRQQPPRISPASPPPSSLSRLLRTTANLPLSSPPTSSIMSSSSEPIIPISISDDHDGGNIKFIKSETTRTSHDGSSSDGKSTSSALVVVVSLEIKPDPYTDLERVNHFQYFSFGSAVAHGGGPITVRYCIENAGKASYSVAWNDYTVFYSKRVDDPDSWRRKLDTTYRDGKLEWTHEHDDEDGERVYFSYFPPFSYSRHQSLIERCRRHRSEEHDHVEVEILGQSLDGRDMEVVRVGSGPRVCWIIHRQHPGEHMAEFYAEGLLTRLLGLENNNMDVNEEEDAQVVRQIREMYTLYIVPNMCPDGAVRGHLRTNTAGANLNREWCDSSTSAAADADASPAKKYAAPTAERSPEVLAVREKMEQIGVCDAFMDIHGDEELPYNFLAQPAVPNWGPRLQALHGAFLAAYCRANGDMQRTYSYEPVPYRPGISVLNKAASYACNRFDCLSVTLEMPFKDCLSNPDPERGWSPARCRALGASVLEPLLYVHPYLRDESDFWEGLPNEDKYVRPTSRYR